jgi:Rhs element Vgr protein
MSRSRVIPTQAATDLPTFTIFVNGDEIGARYGILGIAVTKAINTIPKARIVITDGDVSAGDFPTSSGDLFVPGNEVEIRAGYHNREDTLFNGIITGHSIKTLENRNPLLQVDLRDKAVKMTGGRKNRYYESVTDSEVIEELIGAYGLGASVEDTSVTHKEMVQYYVSDWDFMVARAEVNDRLVFVDDGAIEVKKPDTDADPVLNLAYGSNVISFEADMDARDQHTSFLSRSWNFTEQEISEEEGQFSGDDRSGNISRSDLAAILNVDPFLQQHSGRMDEGELQAWSDARVHRARLAKIRGRVRIIGFSDIKPGDMIDLERFGDRFNGRHLVSSVNHQYSGSSAWYTDIVFGLNPEWHVNRFDDISARQASGLLPAIHGLQPGVVTEIHDDPDGEFRIRVRLPIIDPQSEGVWARVAVPDAGADRGMIFRPEIGDEVIVGCINDDPRDPVILGMVHSSGKPAPIEPKEENNEKGFVTRSGLKVLFDDEEQSIRLQTPDGNQLTISDEQGGLVFEDESGNKVTLSSDGIEIKSSGDLKLKASGDISIEGTNVSAGASASFKAEGSSGASLSSSGQTEVSGSLVTIN